MPGPIPKTDAARRRRNSAPGVVYLPVEGRKGRPPAWPLDKMRKGELAAWREVWATPQAVAWERLGWVRTVARYVRAMVEAERAERVSLMAEARQLEDRLGLSPIAMMRLRWEIVADELGEARDDKTATVAPVRARLRAVDSSSR